MVKIAYKGSFYEADPNSDQYKAAQAGSEGFSLMQGSSQSPSNSNPSALQGFYTPQNTQSSPLGSQLYTTANQYSTPSTTSNNYATPYGSNQSALNQQKTYTNVNDPEFLNLPAEERLKAFQGNPGLAQAEIDRAKSVYNTDISMNPDAANAAHDWADKVRGVSGIPSDNPSYGNSQNTPNNNTSGASQGVSQGTSQQQSPDQMAALLKSLIDRVNNQPTQFQQLLDNYRTADDKRKADAAASSQAYINGQTGRINDFYSNTYDSQLAKLKAAQTTGLAGFTGQENVANQQNYNDRNLTDANYMRSANMLKEGLANQGLTSSGDAGTLGVSLANNNQNAMRQIDQGTTNTLNQIAANRGALNTNEANSEVALKQQLDADKSKQLSDLNQYGDQRSINLDNTGYQRYADMLNTGIQQGQQQFNNQSTIAQLLNSMQQSQRQFGLQESGLTGQYGGQMTLPALMQLSGLTGSMPNGQRTLAGQQMDMSQMTTMASLTGKMPDGTPTNAAQQQQLSNLWNVADKSGTIPNELADMYGIPRGTQTASAKLQAAQANYYNDHGQYYASGGSSSGQPTPSQKSNQYEGTVMGEVGQLTTEGQVKGYLQANKQDIVDNLGTAGYDRLEKSALSKFQGDKTDKETQQKQAAALRQKAISLAQKDQRWSYSDKESLIQEYLGILNS